MKKFLKEFKDFALKGNVMDLAIGMIIGTAFAGIVTSLTDNFINPLLRIITGAETSTVHAWKTYLSNFVGSVINFLIMAFILFLLMKAVNKALNLVSHKKPEAPKTKVCPFCQSEIPIKAVRCPHCTSMLDSDDGSDEE